jgi:hypothetical protein
MALVVLVEAACVEKVDVRRRDVCCPYYEAVCVGLGEGDLGYRELFV